ncbi:hypothetical protein OS493_025209 [Desmophyllum pertusum]|uniref:Uncharacterized protein n=1 Tax=Desmophyllum pertusum TaxID=174260 RepID=A0A9W9ZM32_9CNID|nr:hypothetical protein OS493_025209 [Desmophyllum pertusum]
MTIVRVNGYRPANKGRVSQEEKKTATPTRSKEHEYRKCGKCYTYACRRKRHEVKGCKSTEKLKAMFKANNVKPPKVKSLPSTKRRLMEDDLLSLSSLDEETQEAGTKEDTVLNDDLPSPRDVAAKPLSPS